MRNHEAVWNAGILRSKCVRIDPGCVKTAAALFRANVVGSAALALSISFLLTVGATAQSERPATSPAQERSVKGPVSTSGIEFTFVDFSGKPRKFSEFRGKYVLIDFWATWCRPCLADIPKLKELYAKYKEKDFEILGMDAETLTGDEEDVPDPEFAREQDERARQIVATRGMSWTQANWETAVPIAKKVFNVKALPTKILIDKEGKEIARIGEKDDLNGIVEKLLNESAN